MLDFYNTKLLINYRMDCEGWEYWYTQSPICKHPEDAKGLYHEVRMHLIENPLLVATVKKDVNKLALQTGELFKFCRDWYRHSDVSNFSDFSIKEWFGDYLRCDIEHLNSHKLKYCNASKYDWFTYYEDLALQSIQHDLNLLREGKVEEKEIVRFSDSYETPELSWMVEDFLVNRLKGKQSKYINKLNRVVEANLRDLQFYSSLFNYIDSTLINVPVPMNTFDVSDEISLDNMGETLKSEHAVLLFQTPYTFHDFSTNFVHIRKCLQKYRELLNG